MDEVINSVIAAVLANTRGDDFGRVRCNLTEARLAVRKALDLNLMGDEVTRVLELIAPLMNRAMLRCLGRSGEYHG